jgi:uncharacterized membrane protein
METGVFGFLFESEHESHWRVLQFALTVAGFVVGVGVLATEFVTTDPTRVLLLMVATAAFVIAEIASDYLLAEHQALTAAIDRASSAGRVTHALHDHYENRWFDVAQHAVFWGWILGICAIGAFALLALGAQ